MTLEFQEALLKDINKDILLTNSNLKASSSELSSQGDVLNNSMNKVGNIFTNVKKTDETFVVIERKDKIYRLCLYAFIVLEFLVILFLLLKKIIGLFR